MGVKIIHIVLGKANPNRPNGVNKVVNSLATYQTDIGYDVSVWGITKDLTKNYPDRNYKTRLFKDTFSFAISSDLKKALKELSKNTVLHIHGAFIPQFYLVMRVIRKLGLSYVYTPHGAFNLVALERSKWKKKLYSSLIERKLVKHAKYVHALADSEVEGIVSLDYLVNYSVIPNGQGIEELEYDYSPLREKINTVFGFVGRIDIRTKGLDLLLQGFAKYLNETKDNAELWIVGDGKELEKVKSMAKQLQIEKQVKFWGGRYGEEKLNIISNMDFLCLTSRNEGLPGVVLEASGLGVPCIVSKETNMGKYLSTNHAGLTLPENTADHIGQTFSKADQIKNTNHFQELKKNAKQMVKNSFDWYEISSKMIQLYEA